MHEQVLRSCCYYLHVCMYYIPVCIGLILILNWFIKKNIFEEVATFYLPMNSEEMQHSDVHLSIY